MYLIPRLIGVCTYVSILFIMAFMIRYAAKVRDIRRTLNIYWILVGLMGYFFVPPSGFDLPRLINRMYHYSEMSKETFFSSLITTLTPGERIYYRIIGMFPNAEKMLPCITALICFAFCFSILKNLAKAKDDRVIISVALMLFMARGGMMPAIDTIRAYMASSIIAWCVYQELCKNKSFTKHLPLYIIACSVHALGYILFLLRLLYMLVQAQKSIDKKIFVILGAIAILGASWFFVPNIWTMLFDKMTYYYEAGQSGESYFYIWEGILSAMSVLVAAYLLRYISKLTNATGSTPEPQCMNYCKYMKLVVFVNTVSVFIEYNFFMRMGHYVTILTMPLVWYALSLEKQQQRKTGLKERLILISTIVLLLSCARGYLCSLKFFE